MYVGCRLSLCKYFLASVDAEVASAAAGGRVECLEEGRVHDIAVKLQSLRYSWEISGGDVQHLHDTGDQ